MDNLPNTPEEAFRAPETGIVIGRLEHVDTEPLPFDVVGDNAVVTWLKRSTTTRSGIELAGVKEEKPSACVILGMGDEFTEVIGNAYRGGNTPDVGSRLIVHRHHASKLELADERELYVIKPAHVIGVLHDIETPPA